MQRKEKKRISKVAKVGLGAAIGGVIGIVVGGAIGAVVAAAKWMLGMEHGGAPVARRLVTSDL